MSKINKIRSSISGTKKQFRFFSLLTITLLIQLCMAAQAPLGFNYQAIIRDAAGNVLPNKTISLRISILEGSTFGTYDYVETHSPTTNQFGLVNLTIGAGTLQSGSLSGVDWSGGPYFLKVELDAAGGSSYSEMGTSQLMSVPYSLMSKGLTLPYSATISSVDPPIKIVNTSKTGTSVGFQAEAYQTGIYGKGTATDAMSVGVSGESLSPNGLGISGMAPHLGVYGVGESGVVGAGNAMGVFGYAAKSGGCGVSGEATKDTGNGIGVKGTVASTAGFSGYFKGGKFYVSGRTGIGTESPSAGLHLKGSGFPESFIFLESNTGQDAGFRLYEGSTVKWHIFNSASADGLHIYSNAGTTAIFVKQSNSFVGINKTNPAYTLEVNGTAGKTGGGSWSTSSDSRLKDIKGTYNKGLREIVELEPILFTYKQGNARNLPSGIDQIGFVAQDVINVFPEAVTEAEDGYLDFNIHPINVALVNAVKELKSENENLKSKIDKLESENERLKAQNEQINSRLEKIEELVIK